MTWDYRRWLDGEEPEDEEPRRRLPAPGKVTLTSAIKPVQRRATNSAPPASLDGVDYLAQPVQHKSGPVEHENPFALHLPGTPVQRVGGTGSNQDAVHAAAARGLEAPATQLPHLEQIQQFFGHHDVSHVRAHVGGTATEASSAMGASAYASGHHVAFAKAPDLHTAAHEAAHVVQQKGGVQLKGGVGEEGDAYERHADAVADKVVAGESAEGLLDQFGGARGSSVAPVVVQRKKGGGEKKDAEPPPLPGHNAHMTVRAYDGPAGVLVELTSGPAFFHGTMPASFVGTRKKGGGGWAWSGDNAPVDRNRLRINSDESGRTGQPIDEWAPPSAKVVTVDYQRLSSPFGAGTIDPDSGGILPGGRQGRFFDEPAAGSEPATSADSPGIDGPTAAGVRRFDDLEVIDHEGGSIIQLGDATIEIGRNKGSYRYRIEPQTSPRQRVVRITASLKVFVKHTPGSGPVDLVAVTQHVEENVIGPAAPGADVRTAPEISATGDEWRVTLRMGRSAVHIQQEDINARFAYFVDPEWSGEERTVHIVATPGVRVDQWLDPGVGAADVADQRRLMANPIRVQDARVVPQQGTPIDPAQFLGVQRHESPNQRGNAGGFTVATGTNGVTVRDLSFGATMSIRAKDPTRGANFLHDVDGREFRALVGPGVSIDITETRPMDPEVPFSGSNQLDDFQNVEFLLYQARNDDMPAPGTPLTRDVLEQYGERRKPDSHTIVPVPEWLEKARFKADLATMAPGVGDASDYVDFFLAVSKGEDHWGRPVSFGETLLIGLAAVLPLLTYGAIRTGRRVLRAGKGASTLAKLAARVGRTEEELEAILAGLRRLDPEAQASAKRIEKAIKVGDNIDPRDFERVNEGLTAIGSRTIPLDSPRLLLPGPADAKRIDPVDAVADVVGAPTAAAKAEPVLLPASQLATKRDQLQQQLNRYVKTMGAKKSARGMRVEVIDARTFKARFGDTDKARAKFTLTDKGPVIVARIDATPADMLDEAAHIAQLADPGLAGKIRYLDERNLSEWPTMSAADRLEFYQTKLDLEIDAKQRTLAAVKSPADRAMTDASLQDLRQLQGRVAAITPEQLARMNAGEAALPDFLDDPAHLFGKRRVVDGGSPNDVDRAAVHGPPREVARGKGDADYSGAYSDATVTSVAQHGNAWTETTHVVSGLDGKVTSRTTAPDGSTTIVVTAGGRKASYVLEAGSHIDTRWFKGAKIKNGELIGIEPSREYRRVQVTHADGQTLERQEIRSNDPRRGWVQRGSDSTAKGEIAEDAAQTQADVDLAVRQEAGLISGSVRLPHQNPNSAGGGFDDVIVEFSGEGEQIAAKIRIREVKDYGNRHVPLADFTALTENFAANLDALSDSVDVALDAIQHGRKAPGAFGELTADQIKAIRRRLDAGDFDVEVVLGPRTKLGDPGHHASTTLPALERELDRKVKVERISEEQHSAAAARAASPSPSTAGSKTLAIGDKPPSAHDAPAHANEGAAPGTSGADGPHARRGGPYKEPHEAKDWNQPTRALEDEELARAADLSPTMKGKALEKAGSFAIGKTLATADEGHMVLDLLAKGDPAAFHMIGIHDVPKKFDAMRREWALVQTRDGFVLYAGEPGRVMLPNNVRVAGHTHPRFRPDEHGREAKLALPDDHPGIEIKDLVGQERMGLDAGLIPSAEDIPNIADGTDHILHTRFVQTHDGKIANPADEMGLESRPRVKVHLTNTRVVRYNPQQNHYYYATDIEYRVDGKSLWAGTLFTKAGQRGDFGTRQVTLYMPHELTGPLPKGWVEP